jgi:hypothetical protein
MVVLWRILLARKDGHVCMYLCATEKMVRIATGLSHGHSNSEKSGGLQLRADRHADVLSPNTRAAD